MDTLETKWMATVASIWIQVTSGSSYTFGIYSSTLKSTQSYDQSTLDTVSVFKDIGANVGILSGLLYSSVTLNAHRRRRGGPWVVHAVGMVLGFVGYFFIWASVVGLIDRPPVALMCLFIFLAAQAQTFLNTANVVSGVQNFSGYGGTIVGIMKGFLGLSGAILIQFYNTVCKGNPTTYILLLALTPTVVCLVLMPLVRIYETSTANDAKHLNGFSAVALIIVAYLMIVLILQNLFSFPQWGQITVFVFMVVLLASPLIIAIRAVREDIDERNPLLRNPYRPTGSVMVSNEEEGDLVDKTEQNEEQLNILQAMQTTNFWLLFLAMICGMGSGLATINNISQIGESLRYTTTEINSLVALLSIWNFLGRFGAGYLSDVFLRSRGLGRPLFMAITQAIMSIGHLIIAFGFPGNLYIGSIVVGVCYGAQWSLMPSITPELFGVRHMGTIFNTISVASPVGSYIFSVKVIGFIYDKVASGEDNICYGTDCFMLSFFIMAFVAFIGFLVSLGLYFRTKRFYTHVVRKRLHRHQDT